MSDTPEPSDTKSKSPSSRTYNNKYKKTFALIGFKGAELITFSVDDSVHALVSVNGSVFVDYDGESFDGDLSAATSWVYTQLGIKNTSHKAVTQFWMYDGKTLYDLEKKAKLEAEKQKKAASLASSDVAQTISHE